MVIITDNVSSNYRSPYWLAGAVYCETKFESRGSKQYKSDKDKKHPRSQRKSVVTKESSENEDGFAVVNGERYILHCCRWQRV